MTDLEKMRPIDLDCLCRMLRVKPDDIPKPVLAEYFEVKALLDRIDAPISPYGLQDIIRKKNIVVEDDGEAEGEPAKEEPAKETKKPADDWPEGALARDTLVNVWHGNMVKKKCPVVNAYVDEDTGLTYQVEIEGEDDPVAFLAEDVEAFEETE